MRWEMRHGCFTIDEPLWDRCFRFHLYGFLRILVVHKVSSTFVESSSHIAVMSHEVT